MRVIINILLIFVIITLGYTVFYLKTLVSHMEEQLIIVEKQKEKENSRINLLRSEFSYLSNPYRIKSLATKYLSLTKIDVSQIVQKPLEIDNKSFISNTNTYQNVKWRYKKHSNSFLQASRDDSG